MNESLEHKLKIGAVGWLMLVTGAFAAVNACPYEAQGKQKEAEATAKQYVSRNGKYTMPLNVAEKEIVFKHGTTKELHLYNTKTLYNSAAGEWTVLAFPNPDMITPLTRLPTDGRDLFSRYTVKDELAQIIIEWGPRQYTLQKEWQTCEEGIAKQDINWQGNSPLPIYIGGNRALTKRYVLKGSEHMHSFVLHDRNRRYNIMLMFPGSFSYPKDMEQALQGLQFR